MKLWKFMLAALAAALVATSAAPVAAETLDELIKRGTINVGVILDSPPYGLLDAQQNPDGYDVDVAKLLAKYLGVKLNVVPLVGANRIPFLITGKVDIVAAGLGITPERAKQINFSIPYMAIDNVVFAPKDRKITAIDDMKGLKVGVVRGSAQDNILTQALRDSAQISRFDENPTLVQTMLTKQVDAIALTATLGEQVFSKMPQAGIERKITLLQQGNGIGLRKDKVELLQWVNTFVYYIRSNGELDVLHRKWWGIPLPANLPSF